MPACARYRPFTAKTRVRFRRARQGVQEQRPDRFERRPGCLRPGDPATAGTVRHRAVDRALPLLLIAPRRTGGRRTVRDLTPPDPDPSQSSPAGDPVAPSARIEGGHRGRAWPGRDRAGAGSSRAAAPRRPPRCCRRAARAAPRTILNDASGLNPTPVTRHAVLPTGSTDVLIEAVRAGIRDAAAAGRPVAVGVARHSMGGQSLARDGTAVTLEGAARSSPTPPPASTGSGPARAGRRSSGSSTGSGSRPR